MCFDVMQLKLKYILYLSIAVNFGLQENLKGFAGASITGFLGEWKLTKFQLLEVPQGAIKILKSSNERKYEFSISNTS